MSTQTSAAERLRHMIRTGSGSESEYLEEFDAALVDEARKERLRVRNQLARDHWRYHAPRRGCISPCGWRNAMDSLATAEPETRA